MERSKALVIACAFTLASGCAPRSVLTAPHLPYASMLRRGGQLDVSARGGVASDDLEPVTMASAVQVAYAPIDHLEVAASVDADLYDTDERARTVHAGGGVAIGVFTTYRFLRFEALIGGDAGWNTGLGDRDRLRPDGITERLLAPLQGSYGDAFAQMLLGLGRGFFEFAIGARYLLRAGSATARTLGEQTSYVLGIADVFVAFRVPIDVVRLELLAGLPVRTTATPVLAGAAEVGVWPYVVAGIAVLLDTHAR